MTASDRLQTFRRLVPLLRSVAYRMLGSAADADDILQDAYLRWERASEQEIQSPRAFLTTVVTRLCIDTRRSARWRREQYVGTWLPEPTSEPELVAPSEVSPAFSASLSVAFLVLLENLSPVERAVYLLHAAFDLEYADIAHIVGKTESNCRQIARRAAAALDARTSRFDSSREDRHRLATAFAEATRSGNLHELSSLFAEDVELWSDGGASGATRFGRTRVANKPLAGKRSVLRFISAAVGNAPPGFAGRIAEINGEPGLVGTVDESVVSAISFAIERGLIRAIYIVADVSKLSRIVVPISAQPVSRALEAASS